MTTLDSLRLVSVDLPKSVSRVAKDPIVKRESDYYLSQIGNIKSIDDFMSNNRVYQFATRAFGLQDISYAKAYIRRMLTDGIDSPASLANRVADARFRDFVETFDFKNYGEATTAFSRAQQGTVDRYVSQELEQRAGATNEGVRLALYFQRKTPTITSPYSLLADRALLKVTQVALGLPESSSQLDIARQADLISKRLNVQDLKQPAKLDKFLSNFAALWDIQQPRTTTSPALQIMTGASAGNVGLDLLGQLQNRKKGF